MVVDGMVRTRTVDVGGRAGGVGSEIVRPRMDIRDGVLFWDVLVADIRTDTLRRFPVAASVFPSSLRLLRRRTIPCDLRRNSGRSNTTLRFVGTLSRAVRLGVQ